MRLGHATWVFPLLVAAGCARPLYEDRMELNTAMLQVYHAEAVDGAIVRQHTLYPYHFQPQSAELNELGRRDVGVLARHYRRTGGPVHVSRGDADARLHAARVRAVLDAMVDSGVSGERLSIGEGLPGGEGLSSGVVTLLLEAELGGSSDDDPRNAGTFYAE